MSDDDGFSLSDALENSGVTKTIRTALGLRREAHVCPDCNVACEQATTYNPDTAAWDGGACPSWECPECGEADDDVHAVDLYGRE